MSIGLMILIMCLILPIVALIIIYVNLSGMAKKKTFTVSITEFVYLIYIVRLITGKTPREIFEDFLAGNIKDSMISLAMDIMARLEADGVSIAIEGSVVTLVKTWFRRTIGRKTLVKLGPLRITP